MNKLITACYIMLLSLLMACQMPYDKYLAVDAKPEQLYLDSYFPTHSHYRVETSEQVFSVSQEMTDLVNRHLRSKKDIAQRADQLIKLIFSHTDREIIYDGGANTTAIETFNNRRANCMSLTILAYALAKEANLFVEFQAVKVPEYWIQNGKYSVLAGHVNLLLMAEKLKGRYILAGADYEYVVESELEDVEVDFDPNAAKQAFPRERISKDRMLAMFYNNKAANMLIKQNFDQAYAYLKAALAADDSYDAGWSNLGILYRMTGHDKEALAAYSIAIKENRNNLSALTNLSVLFKAQNKTQAAQEIDALLLNKRRQNPYYHMMLADSASYHKKYEQAVSHYKDSIMLNNKNHDAYFGLAKTYYQLADYPNSQAMMKKAKKYNTDRQMDRRYSAKLSILNTLAKQ